VISRKTDKPPFADVDYDFESPVVIAVLGVLAAIFVLSLVL
jgi:hypothetical protein